MAGLERFHEKAVKLFLKFRPVQAMAGKDS